jgi:hypothetical protein
MWVNFGGGNYPFAVKIATGKVCAITGDSWVNHLNTDPQDYVVIPEQPWLDGYCVEKGTVRQFIAMPLGEGYSVEEQITGAAEYGGLQIMVIPMKADHYEEILRRQREEEKRREQEDIVLPHYCMSAPAEMGLAPGGRMNQEIYEDPHGLDAWDQRHASRCFVSILNSSMWTAITGDRPPTEPPTAQDYTNSDLPWFDYYGGDAEAIEGAKALANAKSVAIMGKERGVSALPENMSVDVERIIQLRAAGSAEVREMT